MNSFFPAEGMYLQNYKADQLNNRSRNFNLIKIPTLSTFSCWKRRFKTQVSACSSFPSEAVDDLKSSRSIQGYTRFPNFEMLDARNASGLNKIVQNSYFKKKVSLEEQKAHKRGSVPSRKTDRSHDLRLLPGYWRS